jgi:hypothetical protein
LRLTEAILRRFSYGIGFLAYKTKSCEILKIIIDFFHQWEYFSSGTSFAEKEFYRTPAVEQKAILICSLLQITCPNQFLFLTMPLYPLKRPKYPERPHKVCPVCNVTFYKSRLVSMVQWGKQKCCSARCKNKQRSIS